ncbi:hypothetical protein Dimus_004561 [Dionaea muscipula]
MLLLHFASLGYPNCPSPLSLFSSVDFMVFDVVESRLGKMLCACSGEQFRHEDPPSRSPESLATRDCSLSGKSSRATPRDGSVVAAAGFSSSASSSRIAGQGLVLEDDSVDEAESTLKEALSLNYEEARALLGRIEYQKGNFGGALQLFQGIDISKLTPRMIKAISERSSPRKPHSKGDTAVAGIMSMPSVTLILEAIFLKAKTLKELGRHGDAAMECKTILGIVESAFPDGMPVGIDQDYKMQDMFHKALDLLPQLCKQAGLLDEAVTAYRRALVKPWNLNSDRLAVVQKDLAVTLLYGGTETSLPPELHLHGPTNPKSNLEEAILLLFILMKKVADQEIDWDPEILDHLTFVLSVCDEFDFLADHVEKMLPGICSREERWYTLALCYGAAGQNEAALNLVRKATGISQSMHPPHIPSLLLGAKLCSEDPLHALEGISFSKRVSGSIDDGCEHFMGQAHKFVGICCRNASRVFPLPSSERETYQRECLASLNSAFSIDKGDPELIFGLALENAVQRSLDAALRYSMMYSNMVAQSSTSGWRLLALVLSAQQRLKDAETVVDLASEEVGKMDHLELLRLKAALQIAQEQPKLAIETCGVLLTRVQSMKEPATTDSPSKAAALRDLLLGTWLDLAKIYISLESWTDAETCLKKAKLIEYYNPKCWHVSGLLFKAKSKYKDALIDFTISLAIEPQYIPSIVSAAEVFMCVGNNAIPIARGLLLNALQLDPTNHDAWFRLGLIAKQEGLLSQAADCFQVASDLKSSAPVEPFLW